MAVVPGVARTGWASTYPADINARVLAVVTGGAPFAGTCTPLPTNRSTVSFPILDSADPAWSAELDLIPDLAPTQTAYEVAVSRLNGSLLISRESIDDTDFPVTAQTELAIQERFSAKLDRDLVRRGGSGTDPDRHPERGHRQRRHGPAAGRRQGQGRHRHGGRHRDPHRAVPALRRRQLEAVKDTTGAPALPGRRDHLRGLATVNTVAATQPFVFDKSRCYLVVRRDFMADISDQTDAAWSRYAVSLRIVGRFALAIPQPLKAARKLTVAGVAPVMADEGRSAKK